MRHTDSAGVERGSPEGRATQMIQRLSCIAELWHRVGEETNVKCESVKNDSKKKKKEKETRLQLHKAEMKSRVNRQRRGVPWLSFFIIRFCVWRVQNVCSRNAMRTNVVKLEWSTHKHSKYRKKHQTIYLSDTCETRRYKLEHGWTICPLFLLAYLWWGFMKAGELLCLHAKQTKSNLMSLSQYSQKI